MKTNLKNSLLVQYISFLELSERIDKGLSREEIVLDFDTAFNPYTEEAKNYIYILYHTGRIKDIFDKLSYDMNKFGDEGKYLYPSSINCKINKKRKIQPGNEFYEPYTNFKKDLAKLNKLIIRASNCNNYNKIKINIEEHYIIEMFKNFFSLISEDKKRSKTISTKKVRDQDRKAKKKKREQKNKEIRGRLRGLFD